MREIENVIMITALMIASWGDWKRKEVSVYLLIGMHIFVVLAVIGLKRPVWDVLFGLGIGLCFFITSRLTREQIGYGDSWLITILGTYVGGKKLLVLLFTASLGAAVFSFFCLMVHRWNRKISIPFIPFLTAAFVGVILL